MHFPIICIESPETRPGDFLNNLPYDDACIDQHTDYYGELYNAEERKQVINSKWFKNLFTGYADVDVENETITFYDKKTANVAFKDYLGQLTEKLYEKARRRELSGYEIRIAGDSYNGCEALFFMNDENYGYAKTSFDLLDDAKYYADMTFRIGNIFDAHI